MAFDPGTGATPAPAPYADPTGHTASGAPNQWSRTFASFLRSRVLALSGSCAPGKVFDPALPLALGRVTLAVG